MKAFLEIKNCKIVVADIKAIQSMGARRQESLQIYRSINIDRKYERKGNSLAVQWLGLRASTAGGMESIPCQGTKILHATWQGQKKKKEEKESCVTSVSMHPFAEPLICQMGVIQYRGNGSVSRAQLYQQFCSLTSVICIFKICVKCEGGAQYWLLTFADLVVFLYVLET